MTDPMRELFDDIATRGGPSPVWEDQWRHSDVDPVSWAWASSTDPHAMALVLHYCGMLTGGAYQTNRRQQGTDTIERRFELTEGPGKGVVFTWMEGDSTSDDTRFQAAGLMRAVAPRAPTLSDLRRALKSWKENGRAPDPPTR